MSAFMHGPGTYNAILTTIETNPTYDAEVRKYYENTFEFVTALRACNFHSLIVRYPRHKTPLEPYKPDIGVRLNRFGLYKILVSVNYQSCEFDEWKDTKEYKMLKLLQELCGGEACRKAPEYDREEWAI